MIKTIILTIAIIASINTMKSFKTYLLENQGNQKIKCDINGICKVIREYESAGNEEKILSPYKDSKGFLTVGHGHLITPESSKIFGELNINPEILSGKGKLTPQEAEKLLQRDVQSKLSVVKKLTPDFENYSPELQAELASETFRGMTGKSPKAMQHLRAGKYQEAANEYLNAKEYREAKAKKSGIAGRMENLANAIKMEGQRRSQAQASPR